jgi:hypothetical protein
MAMCPSYKKTHAQSGIGLSRLLTKVLTSPAQTLISPALENHEKVLSFDQSGVNPSSRVCDDQAPFAYCATVQQIRVDRTKTLYDINRHKDHKPN